MHYVCEGTCKGVSEEPKTCGAADCTHAGEPLVPCECSDGLHEAIYENGAEEQE